LRGKLGLTRGLAARRRFERGRWARAKEESVRSAGRFVKARKSKRGNGKGLPVTIHGTIHDDDIVLRSTSAAALSVDVGRSRGRAGIWYYGGQ